MCLKTCSANEIYVYIFIFFSLLVFVGMMPHPSNGPDLHHFASQPSFNWQQMLQLAHLMFGQTA